MQLQLWPTRRRSGHLGEAAAVLSQDAGVGTLQFPDDLKALVELGEDVDHGAGEQSVLRRLLELTHERRVIIVSNRHSALPSLQRSFPYSVFFVSLQGAVHELHGNVLVFIQPLQHERQEPAATNHSHHDDQLQRRT